MNCLMDRGRYRSSGLYPRGSRVHASNFPDKIAVSRDGAYFDQLDRSELVRQRTLLCTSNEVHPTAIGGILALDRWPEPVYNGRLKNRLAVNLFVFVWLKRYQFGV